jgi:cytochrome c
MIRTLTTIGAALILGITPVIAADAVRGEQRFKSMCGTCHTLDPAQKKIGPHLKGIVGRKSATVEGANYSPALKATNIVWNEAALEEFLADPKKKVPGTAKLLKFGNPQDRADIIAYLATVK